jgi:hypothetical protein
MGKYASELVKVMRSWIGKKESDGSHKEIIDIYNNHKPLARGYKVKYTDSWCATTVSAASIKVGYTDILPTECSCGKMIELFKKLGSWVENDAYTPKAGDCIFYDWDDNGKGDDTGWPEHVGVVEKVENGVITVIEGNYDDSVKRRTIAVNASKIRGYGTPKYDAEPSNNTPPVTSSCYPKYTGESGSIDTVLKSIGVPSTYVGNYKKRTPIAEANGITGYKGTASQNSSLVKLAKQGKLKKPGTGSKPSVYYPKFTGISFGIDSVFKAIGVPSTYVGNYKKRKPIAAANGISDYKGTAKQNSILISLAKQGKLKKV